MVLLVKEMVIRRKISTYNLTMEEFSNKLYLYVQDFGCFACGLSTGLCIFNSDPLKQCHEEKFDGGIALIEMLFRCNYIIIVGGGDFPAFPTNLGFSSFFFNFRDRVKC